MEIKLTSELASQAESSLTWDNEDGTHGTSLEHIQRMRDLEIYVDDEWILKVEKIVSASSYRLNKLLPSDRYLDGDRFPQDINYNTDLVIGLTTKTIDYFGLRIAQVYYLSVDPLTKESIEDLPIVLERYFYNWDDKSKLPTGRIKEIYFYYEDGSLSQDYKTLPKDFYNISDRADITYKRRATVLSWLIARASELGLGKQVKDYFAVYKDLTDKYVLYADYQILKIVRDSQDSWMDLDTKTPLGTVRNSIIICFTKALEPTGSIEIAQYLKNNGTIK